MFTAIRTRNKSLWKRAEYIAAEIKALTADPAAKVMMQMLDWDGRRADLFPTKEDPGRWVYVTHAMLALALRTPTAEELKRAEEQASSLVKGKLPVDASDIFESYEARIRDIADIFLEHLNRFGRFVELNLVSARAFEPYLKYWFDKICDGPKESEPVYRAALQQYIREYKYSGVLALAEKMEYSMTTVSDHR